jgi:serine/threonine-protein kinase
MIGEILGNYRILKKLGEGGMGTVYLARDLSLEREVALKIISPELARNPRLMARFRVEAIAQAKLNHSNITVIHSFDQEKDSCYIVMEFVDGKTLKNVIKEEGAIPVDRALNIFSQVLEGIAYAHSRGVVHRDIKPSNIFLTKEQRVKIGDFGIAKVKGIEGLTKMGASLGSPLYSSPEQLLGKKTDGRTDVYSLGITLYEMLTGKRPFKPSDDSEYKIIKEVIEAKPPKPSELDNRIPAAIDAVLMKSLAKSPDDRFQNVNEFEQEIKRLISPVTPVPEKKEPIKKKTVRKIKFADRKAAGVKGLKGIPERKRILAFALVLSIILVSIILFLIYSGKSKPLPQTMTTGPSKEVSPSDTTQPADQFPTTVKPAPGKSAVTQPGGIKTHYDTTKKPLQIMSGGEVSETLKKMDWFIQKGNYSKAVGVGKKAIKNGIVSMEIYLELAMAYYYDGKKEQAREYYWKVLELSESIRFNVSYQYEKNKEISGTLNISKSKLFFQSRRKHLTQTQFSIPLSQIKRVSLDIMSDITGIFKKKKHRKNPILIIKGKEKQRYAIQLESRDTKLRRFIKDVIDTLREELEESA